MKLIYLILALCLGSTAFAATGDDSDPSNPLPSVSPNATSYTYTRAFLQNEDADRFDEQFSGFVNSGCLHPVPSSSLVGTFTTTPCVAYPGGYRVRDTTASINYAVASPNSSADICWVAITAAASGSVAPWVRVSGSHYIINCTDTSRPSLPPDSALLMRTTITANVISEVKDYHRLSPVMYAGARSTFSSYVIPLGHFYFATDTVSLWLGDGITAGGILIGAAPSAGVLTSIEFSGIDGVNINVTPANPLISDGNVDIDLGDITPDSVQVDDYANCPLLTGNSAGVITCGGLSEDFRNVGGTTFLKSCAEGEVLAFDETLNYYSCAANGAGTCCGHDLPPDGCGYLYNDGAGSLSWTLPLASLGPYFIAGKPAAGQVVYWGRVDDFLRDGSAINFEANFGGGSYSNAGAGVGATSTAVFNIATATSMNGSYTNVGTITFAGGGSGGPTAAGTVTFDLTANDDPFTWSYTKYFKITAPAVQDATLADVHIKLGGTPQCSGG